ncbi:MAG: serine hydrolase domain-containing protein [Wenzhouxiangella sp.]
MKNRFPFRIRLHPFIVLATLLLAVAGQAADGFPQRHGWPGIEPSEAGFDPQRLEHAVEFARERAETEPSDLHQVIHDAFAPREPDFRILGPTRPRAGDSGMIVRDGRLVASWGDTERVDMTFSVVKSYLGTLAGIALRDGLIDDVHDPVADYVTGDWFASEHNRKITWHHLLNQTSDWSGTLWDVPDWADRPEGDDPDEWPDRELHEPGTRFKYNDVRINLLAFNLLQVFREPLPAVLKREIMDPIGASNTWRWHGYENSWVELDGLKMQSVSGGGHFGGGLFISTEDHARFGLLMENRGVWDGKRLLPDDWFDTIREPTPVREDYGYLWWLNTDREAVPAAPESAYYAAGFGGNYIYVDECNDLVVVLRWIPEFDAVMERILGALETPGNCR